MGQNYSFPPARSNIDGKESPGKAGKENPDSKPTKTNKTIDSNPALGQGNR
jgi:hypothetical protein